MGTGRTTENKNSTVFVESQTSYYNLQNKQMSVGEDRLAFIPNFKIIQFIYIQHAKQEIALQIYE